MIVLIYEHLLHSCVFCFAGDCLDMLASAEKAFEEENKFSKVVTVTLNTGWFTLTGSCYILPISFLI